MSTARILGQFVLVFAAGGALAAQDKKLPKWKIDPHTGNDPKLMAKAGYVSYGPFKFGERGPNDTTSEEIEKHLDYERFLWAETAHFRIGLALPEWVVPMDPEIRLKIRTELAELATKLPKINEKTRTLTPWLRLHLTAHRAEKCYREFQELLGVTDADFPENKDAVVTGRGRFMGFGKYLGMQEKYLLLVPERGNTCRDYLKNFIGRETLFGQRWHFIRSGALLYAVGTDMEEGRLKNDTSAYVGAGASVGSSVSVGSPSPVASHDSDTPAARATALIVWISVRSALRRIALLMFAPLSPDFLASSYALMPVRRTRTGAHG